MERSRGHIVSAGCRCSLITTILTGCDLAELCFVKCVILFFCFVFNTSTYCLKHCQQENTSKRMHNFLNL